GRPSGRSAARASRPGRRRRLSTESRESSKTEPGRSVPGTLPLSERTRSACAYRRTGFQSFLRVDPLRNPALDRGGSTRSERGRRLRRSSAELRPGGRGKTTRPEPWSGTLTRRGAADQLASGCGFLPRLAQSAALLDADEAQAEEDDRQEDEQAPAGDAGIDPELRREEPDERIIGVELPSAVAEEELVEVAEEAVPAEHGHNGDSTHEDDAEDRAQSHSGVDAHAAAAEHVEAEEDRADEADERDQIEQRDEPLDIGHVAEL